MKKYIITCIATILGVFFAQADNINVQDVTMDVGQSGTIIINLTNSTTNYVSFQMDLYLPDGFTLNKTGNTLSSRFSSGELTIGKQNDGAYRLTATSFSLNTITGTSGVLLTLSVNAPTSPTSGTANIRNILFATNQSASTTMTNVSFSLFAKGEQSLSFNSIATKTYGDAAYTLPSQTDQGLTLSWSVSNTSVATASGNTLTIKGAGTATVTATQAGSNIYYPFSKTFTLTVTKAPLTITAKSYTITYGSSLPTFAATYSGFKNNETSSVLTQQPTFGCSATSSSTLGTYDINVSGAAANNYNISYVKGTLTINAKNASNLTISSISSQTYTGSAITPTVTVKDGSKTLTNGTDYTVAYSNNTNAGTATVTITGKGNYTGTKTATFIINKAPLTITAKSYTITQGNPLPTFEATYSGFKNGETTSVLTTQPCFSCSTSSTSAPGTYDIVVSGAVANNYTFTYVNGTLTIEQVIIFTDPNVEELCIANWDTNGDGLLSSGEAAAVTGMGQVFKSNKNITSFDELQYFTGLTTIGSSAFQGCSDLTSITIPNSVTSIGDYAFENCSGLTSIIIPNSVTSIGSNAFKGCSDMPSVIIPNSVTSIGSYAFSHCSDLTSVTIPNSVTSIGKSAFYCCRGLTSITIPNSVTSIGEEAFYGCSALTNISVESGNTVFDSRNNCNAIVKTSTNTLISGCKNTIIPNSVTSIGSFAFNGCSGLTSIIIPNSVTSIGSYAFSSCSDLTSVTIPNSVTTIGSFAFNGCSGLISVAIPNSVTSIGSYAFSGCSDLTSVTIPNCVTSIGSYAFWDCSSLTSVTIPNSVTSIGSSAFSGCSGLTSVITEKETPVSISSYVFSNRANAKLYVPKGAKTAYSAANYWTEFNVIKEFPDGDVNEDGETDVVDVVDIARTVIEELTGDVIMHLADLNNSNSVTVADAIVLINDIAGDTNWAKPMMARSRATANDILKLVSTDGRNLSLQMDGNGQYAAFQFDLWLPENVDVMEMTLNNERRQGHQLLYNKVSEGHYRVVALSTAASIFKGSSGELLDMTLEGFATDNIQVDDIRFVTPEGSERQFEALGVTRNGITTSIDGMNGDDNCEKRTVYNLNGQRMNTPQKGLNIINGRKVVIK